MLYTRLLPLLAHGTESVDILEMSTAYGLDFISAFLFGLSQSTNFIQEKGRRRHWLQQYLSHRSKYMFWLQELPNFTTWLSRFGIDIVPKSKVKASRYLEDWCLSLCDAADKVLQSKERVAPGNLPIVYQQLKTAMAKKIQPLNTTVLPGSYTSDQLEIASELLDHLGMFNLYQRASLNTDALCRCYARHFRFAKLKRSGFFTLTRSRCYYYVYYF